jgi:Zn-dependent peptidase ImmA (M78 family)
MPTRERREWVLAGQLAADELRLARGIGVSPIADLWEFIEAEPHLELAFHDFGGDADGVYRWDGRRGLIVINAATRAFGRKRFTAAHELGHHIMHRDGAKIVEIADKNVLDHRGERREVEANAFAAHLLAPTMAMQQACSGTPASKLTVEQVVELMIDYGLSFRTAVYRLHNSGRITARDRDRLIDESSGQVEWALGAHGHREDPKRPTDLPPAYTAEVLRLHRKQVIDDERLAELLGLTVEDARGLVDEVTAAAGAPEPEPDLGEFGKMLDAALTELDS